MKKTALALLLMLALSLPAGCGARGMEASPAAETNNYSMNNGTPEPTVSAQTPEPTAAVPAAPALETPSGVVTLSDVAYVLIFNPGIYCEDWSWNEKLTTGDFASQIDIDMSRAGELEPAEPKYVSLPQENSAGLLEELGVDLSGIRAEGMQPIYKMGDRHSFYASVEEDDQPRVLTEFECVFVGDTCCVWSLDDALPASEAALIGKEFDEKIYLKDVELFGKPRYADEKGKVHLLFYPMKNYGILGYFSPMDIFASGEATSAQVQAYGLNLDHAMVHINSIYASFEELRDLVYGTIAHELQHLINSTDMFYTLTCSYTRTWLNEAMSGYAEETQYPGIKDIEGHYLAFAFSDLIRHGQSLYSFESGDSDIGVYGSVFLFSQYLDSLAGSGVFRRIHDYWRNSYSQTLDEAEALYHAVPEKSVSEIEAKYHYPPEVVFATPEQEWMSKLVLDFYLSLLHFDADDPPAFSNVKAQTLLYDEINPAEIEGGGRVIAATADGSYEIPSDADYGLLYIGLDADFLPVTEIIYK